MPIQWKIIVQVILKLLEILSKMPADADHREPTALIADALAMACGQSAFKGGSNAKS